MLDAGDEISQDFKRHKAQGTRSKAQGQYKG